VPRHSVCWPGCARAADPGRRTPFRPAPARVTGTAAPRRRADDDPGALLDGPDAGVPVRSGPGGAGLRRVAPRLRERPRVLHGDRVGRGPGRRVGDGCAASAVSEAGQ
jgi:hypothetical protein